MQSLVYPVSALMMSIGLLAVDVPLPSGNSMLKDGVAIGALGLALLWILIRTIPVMNRQHNDTVRDICDGFESRLKAAAESEHEDRKELADALRALTVNCAKNQTREKLLDSNRQE